MLALPRGAAGLEPGFGGKEALYSPGFFSYQPLLQHRPLNLGLAGGAGSKFPCSSNSCFSSQRAAGMFRRWMYPFSPFGGPGGLCVV